MRPTHPAEFADWCGWGQYEADCIRGLLTVAPLTDIARDIVELAKPDILLDTCETARYIECFLRLYPESNNDDYAPDT